MVGLNTCVTASKAVCEETYELVRNHQSVGMSNMLTFPSAKYYVERLLRDTPAPAAHVKRRLAVAVGVTGPKASPAYYVAEELAVSGDMDVILAGSCLETLRESCAAIYEEFLQRKARLGLLSVDTSDLAVIPVKLNANSLESVSHAARQIGRICHKYYNGQLHVLVNLGDQVLETHSLTENGVDANIGQNYLAPRLLAERLLPVLRAAATSSYKPRLVQQGSVGHCMGGDFDPRCLRKLPREGGAPMGTVIWNDDNQDWEYKIGTGHTGLEMYYRSKMALMADTLALAKEEPMLAVVSVDTGILSYTEASKSFRLVGLSRSQAARSALRAALDPDFNSVDTMHYLHCDGNPWVMAEPTLAEAYGRDEYAETVRSMGEDLCGRLVADKHCGWDVQFAPSHVSIASTTSFSLDDTSESSFDSEEFVLDMPNNLKLEMAVHTHANWQCPSYHSSLLQYSSLFLN
jgi:NAD(P)-dependent dehydrogenase (short-subunit alcohol dehydrogenase family)